MKGSIIFILVWAFCFSLYAQSNIWYVNQDATGAGNGQSWANAYTDLHLAMTIAQNGDAIWVATGVYHPDTAYNRDRYFELKSGVKIYGGFAGIETALHERNVPANPVTLSGNIGNPADSTDNSYTILYLAYPDTNTRIDGFVFQHGFARNDTNFFVNTPVSSGGAVYILAQNGKALPVFANCTFRDNAARFNGGAIYVQGQGTQGSTPVFQNCRFINNKARIGGAMYLTGGNTYDRGIEFDHCRFEGNYASTQGGAVYFYSTAGNETTDFSGCVVTKNNCASFGSFFSYFKTGSNPFSIKIDSCDIFENEPDAHALIYTDNLGQQFKTKFVVSNCKIFDNKTFHPFGDITELVWIFKEPKQGMIDTLIFHGNTIFNNVCDGLIYYAAEGIGSYSLINNNICYKSAGLWGAGSNIELSGNVLLKESGAGFSFIAAPNSKCIVKNNIFCNESEYAGLTLSISQINNNVIGDSMYILNNLFLGNKIAIRQYWGTYDSVPYFNIISNNIFLRNGEVIHQNDTNTGEPGKNFAYFSHNLMDTLCDGLSDRVICGPGNILANDALFVDTAAFNFHLLPCSPAINSGDNSLLQLLGILQDMEGNPRVAEGTVDIGPFESPAFSLATAPVVHAACTNSPGGAITLSPANGCEPYTYYWQPPVGSGPMVSELPPGDYAYTVTDGRGRQLQDTVSIITADTPALSPLTQDLQCGTISGGTATVAVSGGASPYTFAWNTSATDSLLTMLPAGQYKVTVTDINGCQDSARMFVFQHGQLTLMVDGAVISCFGASDGLLSAAALNGKAPLAYAWSQGGTDSLATGLGPGTYTVTATDFYGCTATFTFTLGEPAVLQAAATALPTNSLQNPNGSASAIPVVGGTQPYTYTWSSGAGGQTITGLAPGLYTVTVTDAHDCTATATAEVTFMSGTSEAAGVGVQVWPNPMTDRLELQATALPAGDWRFVLRDALGRILRSTAVLSARAILDVSSVPEGIYGWELVRSGGEIQAVGKVVK